MYVLLTAVVVMVTVFSAATGAVYVMQDITVMCASMVCDGMYDIEQ